MERRRLLLAASGAKSTIFPVSLIEGDNGEIGVKLFEYIIENADELSHCYFRDNESVYVQGINIDFAYIISDDMIALSGVFSNNILVIYLFNNGVLTIIYD